MYISRIQLQNWRSYRDATFRFKKPTRRRPVVLVGAMNGHGKTSFLLSLYLGLFGRFGLRHAEGFSQSNPEDLAFYRKAIQKFRRSDSPPGEPTLVDVTIAPTDIERENGVKEIRVVRQWYFQNDGRPKNGDAFEEVQLHVDSNPQKLSNPDAAHDRIERYLFPADFMPAFFFDGEQAQTLINNAGENGMRKSVEVLFGTRLVEEARDQIKSYIGRQRLKLGGAKSLDVHRKELDDKLSEREKLDQNIAMLHKQLLETDRRRSDLERQQTALNEQLSKLGGDHGSSLEELQSSIQRTERLLVNAEEELTRYGSKLGISLAVARLAPEMLNRLRAEAVLERWENLRTGTIDRTEAVLQAAIPDPPENDPLLGNLPSQIRSRVRDRFRSALEHIYHPPPTNCAERYRLGHVKGDMRDRLMAQIDEYRGVGSADIRAAARRLKQAREEKQDVEARRSRLSNLPKELRAISDQLKDITGQTSECSRLIGSIERELKSKQATLESVNAVIGQIQEKLAANEPDQKRIAIAERLYRSLEAINERLKPITLDRMQDLVTEHFVKVADARYRKGRVTFPDGETPVLRVEGRPDSLIDTMSGFERRSFGIAFSLALTEMTRSRIPLVIDTPLGNADTEYRPRLLAALTKIDLDQIVILTHDAEVTQDLFEGIESQVIQTFLVKYNPSSGESEIHDNSFFHGVGA